MKEQKEILRAARNGRKKKRHFALIEMEDKKETRRPVRDGGKNRDTSPCSKCRKTMSHLALLEMEEKTRHVAALDMEGKKQTLRTARNAGRQ